MTMPAWSLESTNACVKTARRLEIAQRGSHDKEVGEESE